MNRLSLAVAALSLSVLIASCDRASDLAPAPDPALTAGVITDKVVTWTPGTLGRLSVVEYPTTNVADAKVLASAPIDAQGNFSLTLPTAADVAPYLNRYQTTPREGCTGFFTQSLPNATHYTVDEYMLENTTTNKVLTRDFEQSNLSYNGKAVQGDYFIERIYTAQAHTVTGTLSCPTFSTTLNLNLKVGWNAVVRTINSANAEGEMRNSTVTSPTTLPVSVF
ncbi:hypothetical protein [Deinococcus sp. QL22]|uniref:hypothetical protein n=1 Tax=Deinococcus sp. QL22 TaxID=2939437 RepID=UPI0020179D67|nr:hypothetical protein [Deinococcus sp. QL22]UQN06255.1 hypothetical protein M1R55_15565 [Deinococcus sp. QL22]